jgi:hypothetical protein
MRLSGVDGVVVKQTRRSIDDNEPSFEVDFLHDLRHVGHQRFALTVANHKASLALTRVEAGDATEYLTFGRATLEAGQVMLVVVALRKVVKRLLGKVKEPSTPIVDDLSLADPTNREQPSAFVVAHPVNLEEFNRTQIVANAETDSVRETFRKVGDDLHQKIAVDAVRFSRATNDQPVAIVPARLSGGHYSRISRTKRF